MDGRGQLNCSSDRVPLGLLGQAASKRGGEFPGTASQFFGLALGARELGRGASEGAGEGGRAGAARGSRPRGARRSGAWKKNNQKPNRRFPPHADDRLGRRSHRPP